MNHDYKFPTKDEEISIIEEFSEMFASSALASATIPISLKLLGSLVFSIRPYAFGCEIENAERWLKELLEETGNDQTSEMKKYLNSLSVTITVDDDNDD